MAQKNVTREKAEMSIFFCENKKETFGLVTANILKK